MTEHYSLLQISDLIKKNLMDDIETKNFTMGKDSDGKIIYTDIGKNLNLFQEEVSNWLGRQDCLGLGRIYPVVISCLKCMLIFRCHSSIVFN